jgi:hypothetical protein
MASVEDRIGLIRTSTFNYAEDGTLPEAALVPIQLDSRASGQNFDR